MSPEQFLLCVLAIPAFADNGHDVMNDEEGAWYPNSRLPIRLIWFPDGWVVARAAPEFVGLLGAQVRKIEGLDGNQMLSRLRSLWGGPDSSRRWNLEWIVENAGLLHALSIAKRSDQLTLDLLLPNGQRVQRSLKFVPSKDVPPNAGAIRLWSGEPWPGEPERGWRTAVDGPQPIYLADSSKRFQVVPLPDLDALFVQFRGHSDSANEKLVDVMHAVDKQLMERNPKFLIMDLRFDVGGNSDLTRDWLRALPSHVSGRIYVLVGRYTFSAGIVAAAALKHDGGERVTIVGEELGDRLTWWSEGTNVCLPHSHYCPHLTTGLWDLKSGCKGVSGCYGDTFQVVVGSLAPDLPAPLSSQAWLAKIDPALNAITRDIRSR